MKNILVLGVSGMLGSMVFDYLSKNQNYKVLGTVRNEKYLQENVYLFDANTPDQLVKEHFLNMQLDYVINCIGITKPFCKDDDPNGVQNAIRINGIFPWELAAIAKKKDFKIIQIATDCVYSGKEGNYNELALHDPLDVYGKTKSLGEVFDGTMLNIRCSIIGPELKGTSSFLLEWFLNQPSGGTIGGFEHHIWNGITTLQFAELCEKIITTDSFEKLINISHVHHYVPNNTVNKFELMHLFDDIFQKKLTINRVNKPNEKVDRSLSTIYDELITITEKKDLKNALEDLRQYMVKSEKYN